METHIKKLIDEIHQYSKVEDPINIRINLDILFNEIVLLKKNNDFKEICNILSQIFYEKYVVEYDYWVLVEYSEALYELRKYDEALVIGKLYMDIEPNDPYCMFIYSLILRMNKKFDESNKILNFALTQSKNKKYLDKYRKINKNWESIFNDIRYLLGINYFHLNNLNLSIKFLKSHIKHRRRGLESIVKKRIVTKELEDIIFLKNQIK